MIRVTKPGFEAVLYDDYTWTRVFGDQSDVAELQQISSSRETPGYMPRMLALQEIVSEIAILLDGFQAEIVYEEPPDTDPPGTVY